MNSASFYEKLMKPYYSILDDLTKYYNEHLETDIGQDIMLNYFSPEQIEIPDVQLNLEQICVKVNSINTCTLLIDIVLQLLSECIPPSLLKIDRNYFNLNKLFSQVLYMLENFCTDIKLSSLTFFCNLIINTNNASGIHFQTSFPTVYKQLLCGIESIVQSIEMLVQNSTLNSNLVKRLNAVLLKLIKTSDEYLVVEHKDIFSSICSTILKKSNSILDKELKLHCLSLSDKINLPKDILELERKDSIEINMLAECYLREILLDIDNMKGNRDDFHLSENWYVAQLINVINSLEFNKDLNQDVCVLSYTLSKCLSALTILQHASIKCKKSYSFSVSLLDDSQSQKMWRSFLKIINKYDYVLLQDNNSLLLFLNVVLLTVSLSSSIFYNVNSFSSSKLNMLLQILCLQNSQQNLDSVVRYDDNVKVRLLKYILVSRIILKMKENIIFDKITLLLVNSITKNKCVATYKEVHVCLLSLNRIVIVKLTVFKFLIAFRLLASVHSLCYLKYLLLVSLLEKY